MLFFLRSRNYPEIINNIDMDTSILLTILDDSVITGVIHIFLFGGGLYFIFRINIIIGCLICIGVALKALTVFFLGKKQEHYQNSTLDFYNMWYKKFANFLYVLQDLKSFDTFNAAKKDLLDLLKNKTQIENKASAMSKLLFYTVEMIDEVFTFILYLIGIMMVANKVLSLGELFSLSIYMVYVSNPIGLFASIYSTYKTISPSYHRLTNFFIEDLEEFHGNQLSSIDSIEFKNVSFNLNGKELFRNISFKVSKGDKIALVGDNGSGKTTLISLILGIYHDYGGTILINDKDIREINVLSIRRNTTYVNQTTSFMNDSIENNIYLYRDNIIAEIKKSIKELKLGALIYEKGWDYIVGEKGSNLSGGEKQKILLSRYLIEQKDLQIFDESFSNTEKDYEKKILLDSLLRYENKSTLIFITHDGSISKLFTKILYINNKTISCKLFKAGVKKE